MKPRYLLPLLCCLVPSTVLAQRDPPVWECYLPSITITHAPDDKLSLDLVLKKETGATEHREHEMYLIGYLAEDEVEILEVSRDLALLDKSKQDNEKLFLDVLLERGLVTVLDTQVAPRQGFGGQDNIGRYADGSGAGRDKEAFLKFNTFSYSFATKKSDLFGAIGKLQHFQTDKVNSLGYYASRFKLIAFVPVNDCKYAGKVREGIKGKHDFANHDRVDAEGHSISWITPILYFRPLPYEFEFRRSEKGDLLVYIN